MYPSSLLKRNEDRLKDLERRALRKPGMLAGACTPGSPSLNLPEPLSSHHPPLTSCLKCKADSASFAREPIMSPSAGTHSNKSPCYSPLACHTTSLNTGRTKTKGEKQAALILGTPVSSSRGRKDSGKGTWMLWPARNPCSIFQECCVSPLRNSSSSINMVLEGGDC